MFTHSPAVTPCSQATTIGASCGFTIGLASGISLALCHCSALAGRLCMRPRESACCCHPDGPWELSLPTTTTHSDSLRSHPRLHRYLEWVNPMPENAYFRRIDFKKKAESQFALHPGDTEASPTDSWPGNQWIYQVRCLHDQQGRSHGFASLFITRADRLLA